MKSQLPNDLRIFVNNDVAIDRYFTEACLMDGENFVANLLNIRKGVTATYDPWHRSISTHQHSTYPELSVGKGTYGNYYGMQQFQIKVGLNHEEILLVWALRSTISGNPINIFLYSFAKFEYIDKRKTEKHLKSIHPYMVNTSDSYDLLR
jgi:pantothenate kinase